MSLVIYPSIAFRRVYLAKKCLAVSSIIAKIFILEISFTSIEISWLIHYVNWRVKNLPFIQ